MVAMTRAVGALVFAGLCGCASQSGYSVDVRNNTGETVKLEMIQATKKEEPRLVETAVRC